MFLQDLRRALVGFLEQPRDLFVHDRLRRLGVVSRADLLLAEIHRPAAAETDRPEPVAHAELSNHPDRQLRRIRQVVRRAARDFAEHQPLGRATTHANRERI